MLVAGDREEQSGQVAVRNRFDGDLGAQSIEGFIDTIRGYTDSKAVRP
ncbi:MAG: hypothetical protein HXY20_06825 [Acidobacteria bacterium]|nr:hypothetical protein [Acidobacteriota bacterium]